MNPIPARARQDAGRRRRKFLLTKAGACCTLVVGGLMAACFGLVTLIAASAGLSILIPSGGQALEFLSAGDGLAYVICFLLIAALSVLGYKICDLSIKKANTLPYVPPFREHLAALPAEDILVRGSIEPTADPRELLKAANVGTEIAKEELLRADSRVTK